EGAEIEILDLEWRRLQQHLELVVMLQAEWILAVPAVGRTAAALDVGGAPRFRTDGAKKRGRMKRTGAHLHVIRLHEHTALTGPVALQGEDQILERGGRPGDGGAHSTRWRSG